MIRAVVFIDDGKGNVMIFKGPLTNVDFGTETVPITTYQGYPIRQIATNESLDVSLHLVGYKTVTDNFEDLWSSM